MYYLITYRKYIIDAGSFLCQLILMLLIIQSKITISDLEKHLVFGQRYQKQLFNL